jgi:signal transduction histidine kinase
MLVAIPFVALTQTQAINTNTDATKIGGDAIGILPVRDSILSIQQAIRLNHQFVTFPHPDINQGIAKDNLWARFVLAPAQQHLKIYLSFENPKLNSINIYIVRQQKVIDSLVLGDHFIFNQRLVHHNYFTIPIQLSHQYHTEVYAKMEQKGNTLQVPVMLYSEKGLLTRIEKSYLYIGITTGVLGIMCLLSIFFFITSDYKSLYIFYAGHIFTILLWLWSTEGLGFQYFWPNSTSLATRMGPGVAVLNSAFFISVMLTFCKPYDNKSIFRRYLQTITIFFFIWAIFPFLSIIDIDNHKLTRTFLTTFFICNFLSVLVSIVYLLQLSHKHKIVLFYFYAVVVTLLSSGLSVAKNLGWLIIEQSTSSIISIGVLVELMLMTAAISRQFNIYKNEREQLLLDNLAKEKALNQSILATQAAERKRISRELHDDIGAGLTQISLMSESAMQQHHNQQLNQEIAFTARSLVASMGEIVWSMYPENNTLEQLIIYLREQLHKMLEYSSINNYHLQLPDTCEPIVVSNEIRRTVLLVTKEIVNNAIKYSEASNLTVNIQLQSNSIHGSIYDNGVGFDIQQAKAGNGLRNIEQRIQEVEGNLFVDSMPQKGSNFKFTIPLK